MTAHRFKNSNYNIILKSPILVYGLAYYIFFFLFFIPLCKASSSCEFMSCNGKEINIKYLFWAQ